MFVEEKAAMQLNGNRLLDYLNVEGAQMLDHVGIFPFPLVKRGKGKVSTIFGGSLATYAISAKSRHKKAAIAFLRSLTDKFAASDVIYKMGDIPALKHVPYGDYPSPVHGHLAKELGRAKKIQVHYFKSLPPHPAGVYLNVVTKLLTNDITPLEAFNTVEEALSHSSVKNVMQVKRISG
jgi:ABC-type glycerol-3-phosphate transport system substrate-binding protein